MLVILNIGIYLFLIYFIIYLSFLSGIIQRVRSEALVLKVTNQSRTIRTGWLLLSGIPPFSIFWLKAIVIVFLISFNLK
jgi:Na+-translocating ferredoxin:NAD+ oxidoreductase RnfD subunit